jgi:hypothetical protein
MGSSMVRMWTRRSWLIRSMRAASVVDFPDPVDETVRPLGEVGHVIGEAETIEPADLVRDLPDRHADRPPLPVDAGPEAGQARDPEREVELVGGLERRPLPVAEEGPREGERLLGSERP